MPALSDQEFKEFISKPIVSVISIERKDKAPISNPIWHRYVDGKIIFITGEEGIKAKLIQKYKRATLLVFENTPQYKYASLDLSLLEAREPLKEEVRAVAEHYLPKEAAEAFIVSMADVKEIALIFKIDKSVAMIVE